MLVFERFWRADPARARTTGGTGLGLAIALEDARLHRGWLQAWGEKGRGSVFRLTLPRVAGQPLVGSPLPLGPDEADVITSAVSTLEADLAAVGRADDPVTRVAWPPRRTSDGSARAGESPRARDRTADESRPALAVLAVLIVAALSTAGCVSMPTGGPVQSYPVTQGPNAQSNPYVQIQPQPPGDGWSPKQIVQGFLTASASFGNYGQVALQYLTPQEQKVWNDPTWSAVVYKNGPNVADPVYPSDDEEPEDQKTATVRSPAPSRRRSRETATTPCRRPRPPAARPTRRRRSSWSRLGGQWRISSAPLEVLLTSDSFAERLPAP